MNRKQFVESHGATCQNWNWSWSFINKRRRFIIFGAWDKNTRGRRALILSGDWGTNDRGRKNPGYIQSLDHVRLVRKKGYRLFTFPMVWSEDPKTGKAHIGDFTPQLTEKKLIRKGNEWYAVESDDMQPAAETLTPWAEEIPANATYPEGLRCRITVNAVERNQKARRACVRHHGPTCAVCGFNFGETYGAWGNGFIHVYHVVPIGSIKKEYKVNPVKDLVPVCPNCHAMIHRVNTKNPLTVKQLRHMMKSSCSGAAGPRRKTRKG